MKEIFLYAAGSLILACNSSGPSSQDTADTTVVKKTTDTVSVVADTTAIETGDTPENPEKEIANAPNAQEEQKEVVNKPSGSAGGSMPPPSDAIRVRQPDGTTIHIVGKRNMNVSYTETTDGYTIVRNSNGIYEYAKLTDEGDLIAGGVKANDPSQRTAKEQEYLKGVKRHLR